MFNLLKFEQNSANNLISSSFINKFIKQYAGSDNWHNISTNNYNLGYGFIHYSLVRVFQPRTVLCIGSKYGFVPAIIALACRDNKRGYVDFVDANYRMPENNHWGGVGYWSTEKGKKAFKQFNLQKYIKVHVQTTVEFRKYYPSSEWDYIYFDGDHSYSGIKKDFNLFSPSLRKGGVILFHDIYLDQYKNLQYGVRRFLNKVAKTGKYNIFKLPGRFGLAIIQPT